MATRPPSANLKRERSIPVKVSVDPRPAPTSLPPVAESELRPKQAPPRPVVEKKLNKVAPIRTTRLPVHEWSEKRRRKLMWWLVGGGMTVIVIGWLAVVRLEMSGDNGQNILTEAKKLFSTLQWPGTKKSTAGEQEIRQYDSQVFPQFQK